MDIMNLWKKYALALEAEREADNNLAKKEYAMFSNQKSSDAYDRAMQKAVQACERRHIARRELKKAGEIK